MGWRAGNLLALLGHVVDTAGRGFGAVACHQARVGVHPGGHQQSADDEWTAPSLAVDENKCEDGREDVDDVLDRGCDQVRVTGYAEGICEG